MPELSTIQQIAVMILPVLFAITLHEAAHAFAAWRCGDNTAVMLGRLSLNPVKHIDLIGTIVVPILILISSGFHFIFGWAKPVPINSSQFKRPKRDLILVSAAGPLANITMALIWACILKASISIGASYAILQNPILLFFILSAKTGIMINLVFAFLNLIPIPPLDGGRIMSAILPYNMAIQYEKIEPYGFFILLALLITNILNWIIVPPIEYTYAFIQFIFNLQ